ncbi:nucleotidyltransferase domain-containing protein [Xylophilus sp.]|uniref:nucleotidyltransferase domain-containing protein n=1 Tax=Xylophilus sp. TaxID=2653893 RepID=UPI002D7F9F0B|nr:hypothetical protein [Xylophilus sp.]
MMTTTASRYSGSLFRELGMPPAPPADDAWDPWTPQALARRLREAPVHWYVVGGWALDLWHGEQLREHEDLEFAVLPSDLDTIRSFLSELRFFTAHAGVVGHWPPPFLAPPAVSQFWGADLKRGCWRVDMMLERGTPDIWVYKRDASIQAPRSGIPPCAAPAVAVRQGMPAALARPGASRPPVAWPVVGPVSVRFSRKARRAPGTERCSALPCSFRTRRRHIPT